MNRAALRTLVQPSRIISGPISLNRAELVQKEIPRKVESSEEEEIDKLDYIISEKPEIKEVREYFKELIDNLTEEKESDE